MAGARVGIISVRICAGVLTPAAIMSLEMSASMPVRTALRIEVEENVQPATSETSVSAESCPTKDGRKFASFSRTSMESV